MIFLYLTQLILSNLRSHFIRYSESEFYTIRIRIVGLSVYKKHTRVLRSYDSFFPAALPLY